MIFSLQQICWGWGFAQIWRSFFPYSRGGILKPVFCAEFWCADFAQIFAPIFAQIFGAQIFAQIFGAQIFAQIFLRRFGALKIGVPESRKKMHRKSAEKSATSQWPCQGGVAHSISAFSSRQHVTQSPPGPRTQGEHVSVHRGIFGPKGMLGFAPRFFKHKNLRKIRSAKH